MDRTTYPTYRIPSHLYAHTPMEQGDHDVDSPPLLRLSSSEFAEV